MFVLDHINLNYASCHSAVFCTFIVIFWNTFLYFLNFVEISMLELLIGLVITIAVGYFIVKGYKAAGVLLTAGLALLLIITGLIGHTVFTS